MWANRIASQLRWELAFAIIRPMRWDEFQNLHLKIAREVGAEQDLRAELIEPEKLHHLAFDAKPQMFSLRYLFRRPKLREIAVAFISLMNRCSRKVWLRTG